MQEFQYVVLDANGQRRHSSLLAASQDDAMRQLLSRQMTIVSLSPKASRAVGPQRKTSLGSEALVMLISELTTLIEAGVPLAEALDTLCRAQPADHPLHRVLAELRGGGLFSAAIAASDLRLPEFVMQMIKAGESTGNLAGALRSATEYLESELQFSRDARNALIYPAVLVGSGILATLVMFVFVVPRFATILNNPRADLPLVSKWVLNLGLWLGQHQLIVGLTVAALAVIGVQLAGRPAVRAAAWEVVSRMPVLGRWAWHSEIARWASLLSVLLRSRVSLLPALRQANESLRHRSLRIQADLVVKEVREGRALSQALSSHALLDAAGLNLVRVGERAGSLAVSVATLARIHSQQSQTRLKRFLVLLEPLTILMISVVLGGVMISVMVAITSLTNVL